MPSTQYTQNGDVTIAYEVFGDGEPLLLIMGLDFQMVWWPDGFCERLVEAGFAVARFDNRDTGLSSKPERAYRTTDMVNDALAVMDALGWTSAHVMGGSMGAALAQAMALLHPDRVRTLISCMGAPVTAGPLRMLTYLRLGFLAKMRKLGTPTTRDEHIETLVEIYRALSSPAHPFPEDWARQTATTSHDRSPRDPATTRRHMNAGRGVELPPLSTIKHPTLVINGEDDPLIKPKAGKATAAQIPNATFVVYPGMGHTLPEELWPDVIERIRALTTPATP